MKKFSIFILVFLILFIAASNVNVYAKRALSIKVLQRMLKSCETTGTCPKVLAKFAGITRVVGYVADAENNDIIIIGNTDNTFPPIFLDDFVAALRNAFKKYVIKKGSIYYYSDPGCSIDPLPRTIAYLNQTGKRFFQLSSPDMAEQLLRDWDRVCSSYQRVRVMGIPFNTHFAWVMVKADYEMKRIVDGKERIQGLKSVPDRMIQKINKDLQRGSYPALCSMMHRFWFYPGKNSYLENRGIVVIKRCDVILLTEREYLTKGKEIVGQGKADPIAKQFAREFSRKFKLISRKKPIYRQLEELFRLVALAKIIKFKSPHIKAGLSLDYLLNYYTPASVNVPEYLPGRSNVKQAKFNLGYNKTFYLWIPSCGGVGIELKIKHNMFKKDLKLLKLRLCVLKARPSQRSLFWDF